MSGQVSFPVLSVGLASTGFKDAPLFTNSSLPDPTDVSLRVEGYTMQNGHVNCSFPNAAALQIRIDSIVHQMNYRNTLGYIAGKCLLIAAGVLKTSLTSIGSCMSSQANDKAIVRRCFNSIVVRPYSQNADCEAAIKNHAYPEAMQSSVVQGCNAFSTYSASSADEFVKEAAALAAKFPVGNLYA